jgi:cation diffusion facilitator family transporter
MHAQSLEPWRHEHVFLGARHAQNERRSWAVVALCGATMLAEIAGGWLWGSMALVAEGLHMSTHAGALVIAAGAYAYARRHAHDARFAFGTGKLGDLAAFASAIVLALIALLIGVESVGRLLNPVVIAFDEAIPLAALGLAVNLASAWLLQDDGDDKTHSHHRHDLHAHHPHNHDHADHNLRAAYVHVVADAAVSVLALLGLATARAFGWRWIDPAMGLVGMLVILNWSWRLVRDAGGVLLDTCPAPIARDIARRLETGTGDRISDLHLWRVGPGHHAAVVSLVAAEPRPPAVYKALLADIAGLSHVTIEVQPCAGGDQPAAPGQLLARASSAT